MLRSAAIVAALAVAACGTSGAAVDAADDPTVDAAPDASALVVGSAFVPPTIRFDTAGFGPCELDGAPVAYGARVLVDDCVECQCTTYGLRCRKRATCSDDRCVFVDGQAVAQGGTAIVEACFDCTCGPAGGACTRRSAAPCPADGCLIDGDVIAFGAERAVSECHFCTCDEATGLSCRNVCHPECACSADLPGCETVCAEYPCPLAVLDQERIELSCGSLVCDYSDLVGAPACE